MKNILFYINISDISQYDFDSLLNVSPRFKREKILKMRNQLSKYQSLAASLILGYSLKYFNKNIDDFEIVYNQFGKPFITDLGISFNISHSKEYVICFISDCEVGCDIQYIDLEKKISGISKRFYSKNDNKLIDSFDNQKDKSISFYRIWAGKEAYIKALGKGLSIELDSFDVSLPTDISSLYNINELFAYEPLIDNSYACCLCSYEEITELEIVEVKCKDFL